MTLKTAVRTLLVSAVFTVPVAFAQDSSREEEDTRVTPAMSQDMYERFSEVAALGSPQEEGVKPDLPAALEELNEIREYCQDEDDNCNKYELATMYNYYGWLYYALEQPKKAMQAYENLVAQAPDIPLGLELGTMYKLAQLHYAANNYREALGWLNDWMDLTNTISAQSYVMRSQIFYQLGQNDKALRDVNKGVAMEEADGDVPQEGWYNLQRALYLDKEDYQTGIKILEKMLVHYPKVQYWRQLAQLYGAVGRQNDQLYILDALYVSDLLENGTDVKNLALLLLGEGVPYDASQILGKAIDNGLVEDSSRNLEILANALRLAQEIEESIPVMARAAEKAEDGDLYARLAAIYLDADSNQKAINAAKAALDRGEIQRPGFLYLTKGMAHFQLEEYDAAIDAFEEASKIKEDNIRDMAARWKKHVVQAKNRAEQLRRAQQSEPEEPPPVPEVDV